MSSMTTTATQMGRVLKEARQERGWSLDDATFEARIRYPHLRIGRMKIHRYEAAPVDRDRLDVPAVMALAELYDLRLSEIDPGLSDEVRTIRELADRVSPCNPDDPTDRDPKFRLAA